MIYLCHDQRRRTLVAGLPTPPGGVPPRNGLDYLEVVDREFVGTGDAARRQKVLRVFFVRPPAGPLLGRLTSVPPAVHVVITGGERIHDLQVKSAAFDPARGCLTVAVDRSGDYSTYTLHLVEPGTGRPLDQLDPQLAAVDFSFKVECPSDLDCRETPACPPVVRAEPELDYLAKDFHSFRQLMLDRLALIAPQWRERNPVDLGITLVELNAYVGDYLSYRQDAVATEAYLGTARQRVSIRRHARLLDYAMHEGCNARVWIQVVLHDSAPATGVVLPVNAAQFERDPRQPAAGTSFTTEIGRRLVLAEDAAELTRLLDAQAAEVFEPLHAATLYPRHGVMKFYTWDDAPCCLPAGATKAALATHYPNLKPGDALAFVEQFGPRTGNPADADLAHRHVVRLTRVTLEADPVAADGVARPYTGIEWADADALPFALTLSSIVDGQPKADVSVALGNLVLADHGRSGPLLAEELGEVPPPNRALVPVAEERCGACADESPAPAVPARFRPGLARTGLTHAVPLPEDFGSRPASGVLTTDPREALPAVTLRDPHGPWTPRRDLIGSEAADRHFVVEIENDGRARLRFGDGLNGQLPAAGTTFQARYRRGSGGRGNVGVGALTRIYAPAMFDAVTGLRVGPARDLIATVTNPLPARGGVEPEKLEDVRHYAPEAFKTPRRCVTPEDYAQRAGEHPDVQRAAATLRWTGSWPTIFVTVDRRGGRPMTAAFKADLRRWLEAHRLAGHDLEIADPIFVALELALFVCVEDGYFCSDVKAALLDTFSPRRRPDGTRGFFHPDNFSFGDPLYVSAIYAAAQRVPGVRHVALQVLRRQGTTTALPETALTFGRLEILRLDHDPNFPDHGTLNLELRGGR